MDLKFIKPACQLTEIFFLVGFNLAKILIVCLTITLLKNSIMIHLSNQSKLNQGILDYALEKLDKTR